MGRCTGGQTLRSLPFLAVFPTIAIYVGEHDASVWRGAYVLALSSGLTSPECTPLPISRGASRRSVLCEALPSVRRGA